MTNDAPQKLPAAHYQSVLGYARDRGMTAEGVQKQIKQGRLKAYRVGRAWIVSVPKKQDEK